jgi:hypothetical protein
MNKINKKQSSNLFQQQKNSTTWNTGTGTFWFDFELDHERKIATGRQRLACAVEVQLGPDTSIALFDTGSEYTIISKEMADFLENLGALEWINLTTKHYSMILKGQKAQFAKCDVTFLAKHWGNNLTLRDVTVLVPGLWPSLVVVGVKTCLERMDFAFDMPTEDYKIMNEGLFYFSEQR